MLLCVCEGSSGERIILGDIVFRDQSGIFPMLEILVDVPWVPRVRTEVYLYLRGEEVLVDLGANVGREGEECGRRQWWGGGDVEKRAELGLEIAFEEVVQATHRVERDRGTH